MHAEKLKTTLQRGGGDGAGGKEKAGTLGLDSGSRLQIPQRAHSSG